MRSIGDKVTLKNQDVLFFETYCKVDSNFSTFVQINGKTVQFEFLQHPLGGLEIKCMLCIKLVGKLYIDFLLLRIKLKLFSLALVAER